VSQYDLKNERMFLRRVKVDDLRRCDLRIGNCVNVLSRRLKIVDYARVSTKTYFGEERERYSVLYTDKAIYIVYGLVVRSLDLGPDLQRILSFS